MKKNFFAAALVITFAPQLASALELSLQPRFKTGVQYYEYEQDSLRFPARDPEGLFPDIISGVKFSDWLPFVGGGVTLFVERFLVDFDVQYSFDGQDDSSFTSQNFLMGGGPPSTGSVLRSDLNQDADFDRIEWAASAGFAVTENFVIFAGYKRAKTDFDVDLTGEISGFQANDSTIIPFLTGSFSGKRDQKLDYDGPFIGASYNFKFEQGFLEGGLSFNVAVAFMDGNVDLEFKDVQIIPDGGQAMVVDFQTLAESQGRSSFSNLDGETTGISVGANWKGLTAINGLTYFVGVNGYRYQFDGNDTPDFDETQVRLDFGLAYAIEF